ncbi:YggS family pyridoxal phosphate-dependent enzyme [uncultured Sunxiuqinia sp.]|uniref:YggS family pyridoxal phosphate-dependent enzyme n=1 Tax=uncultured Sunxiuqinia sp. TaxID=1573825 RepID=UPI002AA7D40E|nr:YggS family pyridoxal phosphate-dependent enzyme [uncultured Sunxiuqinia sp.]
MGIVENYKHVNADLKEGVKLVAVSKTKPNEDILEAYEAGCRIFGENKVQELTSKYEELPKDIEWHFIGHLQSNKVKYIAPFISLIHGIDSLKLLKVLNKEGRKNDRVISCLLQFHIAEEQTKFGLDYQEAVDILTNPSFADLQFVEIRGVMGMATYTDDLNQVRKEFQTLKSIFSRLKEAYFQNQNSFTEISMGMSGDYQLAIGEGSTMVRIGSKIFGERQYH